MTDDPRRPDSPIDLDRQASLVACLAARGLRPSAEYVETVAVTDGVTCDVYRLRDTDAYDLAVVRVLPGKRTPAQRVLSGLETVEGHVSGRGTLTVRSPDGNSSIHRFPDDRTDPVSVRIGEVMRWHADGGEPLVFFEVCAPPYADGRFENLDEA